MALLKLTRAFYFTLLALAISKCRADCLVACENAAAYAGSSAGVDPHDGSYLGVYVRYCPCQPSPTGVLTITLTGTDGIVTTTSSSTIYSQISTDVVVTYDYNLYNTAIQSGSPVTLSFVVNGVNPYGAASWINSPITSIHYVEATSTVTSTAAATTTSTTTDTVTVTESIPQQTNTVPCTTGTETVTAGATTITSVKTIRPRPVTWIHPRTITVIKHATCIRQPSAVKRADRRLERRASVVNSGLYETPWFSAYFGAPPQTTFTTGTDYVTTTTTSTVTDTEIDTETDTTTQTPTPLTTTVCNNVEATTTTTPTVTHTKITTGHRKTIIITTTEFLTSTIYNKNPPPPCTHSDTHPQASPRVLLEKQVAHS